MVNNLSNQGSMSMQQPSDLDFERELLASKLVSEVHRSPNHLSVTLTGDGVLAFVRAMQTFAIEEGATLKFDHYSRRGLFPEQNEDLIAKKDVVEGLGVSHTTLWKWEKSGYLVPVKVGKRVYYKRDDLEKLAK